MNSELARMKEQKRQGASRQRLFSTGRIKRPFGLGNGDTMTDDNAYRIDGKVFAQLRKDHSNGN